MESCSVWIIALSLPESQFWECIYGLNSVVFFEGQWGSLICNQESFYWNKCYQWSLLCPLSFQSVFLRLENTCHYCQHCDLTIRKWLRHNFLLLLWIPLNSVCRKLQIRWQLFRVVIFVKANGFHFKNEMHFKLIWKLFGASRFNRVATFGFQLCNRLLWEKINAQREFIGDTNPKNMDDSTQPI